MRKNGAPLLLCQLKLPSLLDTWPPASLRFPTGAIRNSLMERSLARKCNSIQLFPSSRVQQPFSFLHDSVWICFLNNPFLITKAFLFLISLHSSLSVHICWKLGGGWEFALLVTKKNVYETTKSTPSKPYNSIFVSFFFCFSVLFSFFFNISKNVWHLVVWFKEYKIFLLKKTMVAKVGVDIFLPSYFN